MAVAARLALFEKLAAETKKEEELKKNKGRADPKKDEKEKKDKEEKEKKEKEKKARDEERERTRPPKKGSIEDKHKIGVANKFNFWQKLQEVTGNGGSPEDRVKEEEKKKQQEWIVQRLDENWAMKKLSKELKQKLASKMFVKRYQEDDNIIVEGSMGDYFYVVDEGVCEVSKEVDGKRKLVAVMDKGSSFGELALLYNTPRSSTVTAKGPVTLHLVAADTLKDVFSGTTTAFYADFLSHVKLFENLQTWELARISECLVAKTFSAGEVVIKQGEVGDVFYLLVQGCAEAFVDGVGLVKKYDSEGYFGELALLDDSPRAATVKAVGELKTLTLQKKNFQNVLGPLYNELRKGASAVYGTKYDEAEENKRKDALREILKTNWLISKFPAEACKKLPDEMFTRCFEDGDYITKEGKIGDFFYVVESGTAVITKKDSDGQEVEINQLGENATFGELAIFYASSRTCSVRARGPVVVQCCSREVLLDLSKGKNYFQHVEFLQSVSILSSLSVYDLARMSEHLQAKTYADNEVVFSQGDIGDAFYFIEDGRAKADVKGVGVVCEYATGGFFGELALLEDVPTPRAASIIASGKLKVLALQKADFSTILGKMYPIFKKQALQIKEDQQKLRQDHQAWVAKSLRDNWILSTITEDKRVKIGQRMTSKTFEGTSFDGPVIQEGTEPDYFYLIESGEAEVWAPQTASQRSHVRRVLERGASFGELSALFGSKRTVTVKAKGKLVVSMVSIDVVKEQLSHSKIAEYAGFLAKVNLLAELPRWDLARLAQTLHCQTFKDGEKVIEQGQVGDKFYLIREGHAEALVGGQVVKKYDGEGYFGELALLDDSPRAATVVARGSLAVLSLNKMSFQNVLGRLYVKLQKDAMSTYSLAVNEEEVNKKRQFLHDAISKNWVLGKLSEKPRSDLIGEMFTQTFEKDKLIITEGTAAEFLYVLVSGQVIVGHEDDNENFQTFATLDPGACFGELSILYRTKRTCSIKAVGQCTLEAVSRDTVLRVAGDSVSESYEFLKQVPILQTLGQWELALMAEKLTEETFNKNVVVIRQGDIGDRFYLIKSGKAQALVGDAVVKEFQNSDYFGELALLEEIPTPRAATVIATRSLTTLSLSKKDFQTVLGSLYASFKANALQGMRNKKMEQRAKVVAEIVQSESLYSTFLGILVEHYMQPCQELETLPQNAVEEIFSNVEEIMNVHEEIAEELQTEGNVAATFLKHTEALKSYAEYVSNHADALAVVNTLITNTEFQALMNEKRSQKETTGGLDLKAYLKMPIQRIARIRLLLQDLGSCTPQDHPEYKQIQQAVQSIKNLSSYINKQKKKKKPKNITTELNFWQQFRQITGGVGYEEGVTFFFSGDNDKKEEEEAARKQQQIASALEENWSTKQLAEDRKAALLNDFEQESCKAGDVLVKMGTEGDFFFVLTSGEVEVCIPGPDGSLEAKNVLEKGASFGEIALLFATVRSCTIRAVGQVEVHKVAKVRFLRAFEKSNIIQNVNFLQSVKLFEPLKIWDIARLSQALTKKIYSAKEAVISQGEVGDTFYVIVQGTAEAVVNGKVVYTYQNEGYFGELALLDDSPRAASVVAVTGLTLVCISKTEFQNSLGPLYMTLREHAAKTYNIQKDEEAERKQLEWLMRTLDSNWIIKTLPDEKRRHLVQQMYVQSFENDDEVVQEGKIGDKFFIISDGVVQVVINGKAVVTLEKGATFGELAVLYRTKRTATIRAKGTCVCYCATEEVIRDVFKDSKINKYADFLRTLDILSELDTYAVAQLSEKLLTEDFAAGQSIVRKGETGDRFYLVESGQAQAMIDGKVVKTYGKGGYFGELALLEDNCSARAADVVSLGVAVLSVDKATFRTVLGKVYSSFQAQATRAREEKQRLEKAQYEMAMKCLANHWLCSSLTDEQRQLLLSSAVFKNFQENETLVEAGAASDQFYVVQEGEVVVWDGVAHASKQENVLEGGGCFGEVGCILDIKRTATITARTAVTCRVVPSAVLNKVLAHRALRDLTAKLKQQVSSLSSVGDWALLRLAASAALVKAASGTKVLGGPCDKLYVLVSGNCAYEKGKNSRGSRSTVFDGVFGEVGVFLENQEEPDVVALVDSELVVIERNAVMNVLESKFIEIKNSHDEHQAQKAHKHIEWLVSTFKGGSGLTWWDEQVSSEKKLAMAKEMYPAAFKDGEVIIEYGKLGDVFYVVEKGEVEVWVPDPIELVHKYTQGKGFSFGELAVLYNTKRTSTIKGKGDVLLNCAKKSSLLQAFEGSTITQFANFLESVEILAPLDVFERARLSTQLRRDIFQDGDLIFKKGDPGNRIYMVESGAAEDDTHFKFKAFSSFGERALLEDEITPYPATMTASGPLVTLSVDKDTFQTTMGKVYETFRDRARKEKRDKLLLRREKVIDEMVQSEALYVDFLRTMIDEFMNRMKSLNGITEEHISKIFSNIETIKQTNERICAELSHTRNVAKVFNQFSEYLKCYSSYVGNYDTAMETISGLKKNKAFQKFLDEKRKDTSSTGGLDLMSYLIMPIQRLPRYRMLITEVVRYTPEDSDDFVLLGEVLEKVKKVAAFVNENQRNVERSVRLLRVSKEIVGKLPEELMQPNRFLVADFARCQNVARKKEYRLICFNDIIIVCGAVSNKYKAIFHYKSITLTPNYNVVANKNEGINIVNEGDSTQKEPTRFKILNPTEEKLAQCDEVIKTCNEYKLQSKSIQLQRMGSLPSLRQSSPRSRGSMSSCGSVHEHDTEGFDDDLDGDA